MKRDRASEECAVYNFSFICRNCEPESFARIFCCSGVNFEIPGSGLGGKDGSGSACSSRCGSGASFWIVNLR